MLSFPQATLPKHFSPPLPHTCDMSSPSHSSRFDQPNNIWWGYKSWSILLCSLLHSPVNFSPLGPDICLSTLFMNTLIWCSSFSVRDQVPHPCKATDIIIVLCILMFIFLDSELEARMIKSVPWPHDFFIHAVLMRVVCFDIGYILLFQAQWLQYVPPVTALDDGIL